MGSTAPDTSGWIDLSGLTPDTTQLDLTTQDLSDLAVPPSAGSAGSQSTGGIGTITDVVTILTEFAQFLAQAIQGMEKDPVLHFFTQTVEWAAQIDMLAFLHPDKLYKNVIQAGPGNIIRDMMELGLGVDTSKWNDDANRGLDTADRIVGFSVLLQLAIAAVDTFGEGLLANRFGKVAVEAIRTLPEEMGLSWALGIVISDSFKAAIGTQLEAAIYRSKRPNEPEWQIARAMVKQHVISDADLQIILENAGFSDDWIDKIKRLETQPLPIGDIQGMYQSGIIAKDDIDKYLLALGFSDDVRELLKEYYLEKAQTISGAELRTVNRSLFRDSLIPESEYRNILASVNFPQMLIDDDVTAVKDEKAAGWRQQSVAVIKSDYLHNPGSQATAISKLQVVGYSQADATDMVNSWTAPPIRRQHGLTEAQILKYHMAGIDLNPSARDQLLTLGLTPAAADFLLAHPTAGSGVHPVRLTPALVTQAYLTGAIQQSDLMAQLQKAGATGDSLTYLYDSALYKYAHHHEAGSGKTPLSEGQIVEAFKYRIFDQPTATTALEGLGFSQSNATTILEIANKGIFRPNQAPEFGSVGEAVAYLTALGITVSLPVSATYEAAISMVESAGLGVSYPPNFTPPLALDYNPGAGGSLPPPNYP